MAYHKPNGMRYYTGDQWPVCSRQSSIGTSMLRCLTWQRDGSTSLDAVYTRSSICSESFSWFLTGKVDLVHGVFNTRFTVD